ncbi:MAG: helix-turn-helix transcriptional regulator [Streptosporangiaceae bacterium]
MTSPLVRRRRLGVELRDLREARGLTTEQLGGMILQSRMKITRLENAQVKPNIRDVMNILDVLEITGDRWMHIIQIAREAGELGWWDRYGDAMGDRQRLYADVESGSASIREYQPGTVSGILQTPDYIWALIELAKAEGPINYQPERLVEARIERQTTFLRPGGPSYEIILDEVGLRRFSVDPAIMSAQLHRIRELVEVEARLSVRIFPLVTGKVASMMPSSQITIFTFPDPADPVMAVDAMLSADHVHTAPERVAPYLRRYETVRNAALSGTNSLRLLSELADEITDKAGPAP